MSSILPIPKFDENTHFHEVLPSNKTLEARWISETINPNMKLGIVSVGHEGIELAKLDSDIFVFMPSKTPTKILDKTRKHTKNVYRMGKNYPECYREAEINISNRGGDMLNVSAGMVKKHVANREIVEDALRHTNPEYIFVPSSNLDLCVGILEGLKEQDIKGITVVACILPDNLSISPRFNTAFHHKPYYAGVTSLGFDAPALNRDYKSHNNFLIKTVRSPEFCYYKYSPYYPKLDAMNYLSMEICTKFNKDVEKLVIVTGENLLE